MGKLILFLMFLFLLPSTHADDSKKIKLNFSGDATTRLRSDENRERVQERVILKIKAHFSGGWEVVGVGVNGPSYNDSWNALYDSNAEDRNEDAKNIIDNFSFRTFYLAKTAKYGDKNVKMQAGALNTESGLSGITALDSQGWVDGLRLNVSTSYGEMTFTAGSITDPTVTDFYEREFEFNYFELKLSREALKKLLLDFGVESYEDELFLKAASKYDLDIVANKMISILSEILYNLDDDTAKVSVGATADLIDLLTGKSSSVKIEIRQNYMSEDMGLRGTKLTSGFGTSKGSYSTLGLSGNITKDGRATWFVKWRHNYDRDDRRIEGGIKVKYK